MSTDWRGHPLAVITGASSGIGKETARVLAERGYATLLVARRTDRLNELANELSTTAPSQALAADLIDPLQVKTLAQRLRSEFSPVRVLVNNAGSGGLIPFSEQTDEHRQAMMRLHYHAPAMLIDAVLPGMLESGAGHVVNVTSIAVKMAPFGHSAYAAAKAALVAMTQSLAAEYHASPVKFSYINPGIVRTEFFEDPTYTPLAGQLHRHGISPRRVARRIAHLLDHPQLEVTVPWHYRIVDLLQAISPTLLHRIVLHNSRPGGKGKFHAGDAESAGGERSGFHAKLAKNAKG
ncbi:MAG: SDR family NAD(P)-dependent oxidoreductase [Phycisphaera sp.]|nr:SDR family NAD(P)-dependent oxidoreductase [Phycisphaera sp.]